MTSNVLKKIEFLPFCYYPTTVIFIDDDHSMVESMCFDISRYSLCEGFEDPRKALNFTETNIKKNHLPAKVKAKIALTSLVEKIKNKNRHKEISVMVVDYAMPQMNGIEFCQYFKASGIKKIMLTGEGDHKLAVKAFNADILDHFILKSSLDLPDLIENSVQQMQRKYFEELSIKMNSYLKEQGIHLPAYFRKKAFISFFLNFLEENNITEYYLMNEKANFLLLNNQGKKSCFAIYEEKELKELIKNLQVCYQEEPNAKLKSYINKLKARESIPFPYPASDAADCINASELKIYPAKEIELGDSTFYFAHIKT